jgi:hypothetical protein
MANFEVLSDLTDKPLKGKLSDKELSGLLVTPDLTEGDGTRTKSVRLLDSSSGSLWVKKLMLLRVATATATKGHT